MGIQDAAGKAISRILKERLFAQISGLLEQYPQFAYLCNRSTSDAIKRVEEHCRLIRSRIAADRVTLHQRKSGKKRPRYQGGAQLALDMTTAFDKLPRQSLADALTWAGVDANLRSLILDVHEACSYRIEHEGFVSFVDMQTGVRQGCTLAPLLWALFSVYLLHCIEGKLQSEWPRQAMTLYADDTHCAWELNTLDDLQFLQRSALAIFEVYREHGMVVNESKSAFIIRLGGTHGAKWLKEHLRIIDGKKVIQLSHGLRNITVPVVKQVKYLGVMVSYFDFEMASVRYRLQAAGVARQRLARAIHSSRYLGLAQRLQIYEACVRTTLLYGVSVMKLLEKAVTALHRRDVKYVRAVAKSPFHITREATSTLLDRLQIKSVVEILARATTSPVVKSSFDSLRATEPRESSTTMLPVPDTTVQHACPTCGLYFPSRHIMKIHHKRKHKISLPRTQKPEATDITQAELIQHSKDGMPHCKYCSKRFAGWAEFRWHVVNACESRPQDDAPMNTLETPEQQHYVSTPGMESECELAPAVSDLGSADAAARPAWQFAARPAPAYTEAENLPLAQRAELTTALLKPQ